MPLGRLLFSALSKLISSPLYGSSYRLLQVAALLIIIRPHDKALNKSLPSGITLKGHFSLKRLQWPHMNTTNLEMHNFEVNWKVPPLVETADDAHTILVGTPIVLNPPTKADDL
jgi:hypothetical protein